MSSILQLNPESEVTFIKKDIASLPEARLEVRNNSEKTVIFKIKTTNPAKYIVKPNYGFLSAGKGTKVLITTQKPSMQKIKNDRFLVVGGIYDGPQEDIPKTPSGTESFMRDFFEGLSKDGQFTKKLKIVNDETLGLTYASFKGNRTSIIKPDEDPSDPRSSGVILKSQKHDQAESEEKYNDLLSKVNELSKKKIEIGNSIKIKKNNRDLMDKARYATTSLGGSDSARNKSSDGSNFSLFHIGGIFLLFFIIGLYYSSG
eukprot:CAMPEP_0205823188 /NCGR_PEP_ID=MMETSP0206-20130828/15480_1 /ASSEMBLY_ACC=CAM_ASM_000279 /TAXON_ID=36767 /ORGANISM="Euplotes focardii, Strain TN1" /LENGTH=258 /DNA_ID=CAMNT_0053120131 /DNA_START=1 /DNA_END=777 /DNA_ORIENTATION=+